MIIFSYNFVIWVLVRSQIKLVTEASAYIQDIPIQDKPMYIISKWHLLYTIYNRTYSAHSERKLNKNLRYVITKEPAV